MVKTQSGKRLLRAWGPFVIAGIILLLAPLVLSDFRLNLLGKFLTFAIMALGLDLIWGYGGMLSLGQGLFFGLGGYALAMYMKLEAANGRLPDFMVWSGLKELPLFWLPFQYPIFALIMVFVVPAVLAGLLGYFVFRSRVTGVYFSIITQAMALLTSLLFIGQQPYTGGTNGMTNLSTIFGMDLASQDTQVKLYLATVVVLGLVYIFLKLLVNSRYGRVLVAIRDDEDRVRFLGYDPVMIKTVAFIISAILAGIAGALFVPQVGIISPSVMEVVFSIEVVIWVAVGGRGTLVGAVIGTLLVNWGRSLFSEQFPDIWQYFLGGLFIVVVLVFPKGIVGTAQTYWGRLRSRRQVVPEPARAAAGNALQQQPRTGESA